ncbi:hypothetical protein [Pectobacterium versatile]|uniref:hypothetical protein n=1 Tax=Pectobacterium versatile TaxID=2488639 RepID=UPI001CCE0676|nr:hypothetical protein [Pectobacterium versatile]
MMQEVKTLVLEKNFFSSDFFQFNQFEINTDLPFHVTGVFDWVISSASPFYRKAEINGLTGNMSGDFEDMMKTPSIINRTSAISYGFYDAGSGSGGLTNRDQNYVYITPNMSKWMGDAAGKIQLSNHLHSTILHWLALMIQALSI